MTHGFDSNGRQYDAEGNLRDWWTAGDALAFEAEAQKLVDQANAFEVLPGLTGNGALEVAENIADVGGVTLASEALRRYLADHPEQDVAIDGLSPLQRCFIAWAQMWTSKTTDQLLRTQVAIDPHPASSYRAVAPLKHLDAFHEAFAIGEGDPMWLPPESRVDAW
jgi:putative endopeptidase